MKPTLVILAAGMGSRYGGLKQIDGVGPSGETIIEYSIYDAIRAGFGKVVFIIRKDIEEAFRNHLGQKFAQHIEIAYVHQELDIIPDGLTLPAERKKPWGTGHAMMMCKDAVKEPFAIINADDFYGKEAFQIMAAFLQTVEPGDKQYSMVGYPLELTLSDFGSVSRGECETDSNGYLQKVTERVAIQKEGKEIVYQDGDQRVVLDPDTTVSMNFWGFTPSIFSYTESFFRDFFAEKGDLPKSEFYIPIIVTRMIEEKGAKLKVLKSSTRWFGVTYKEDKPYVVQQIRNLVDSGDYPENLWKNPQF